MQNRNSNIFKLCRNVFLLTRSLEGTRRLGTITRAVYARSFFGFLPSHVFLPLLVDSREPQASRLRMLGFVVFEAAFLWAERQHDPACYDLTYGKERKRSLVQDMLANSWNWNGRSLDSIGHIYTLANDWHGAWFKRSRETLAATLRVLGHRQCIEHRRVYDLHKWILSENGPRAKGRKEDADLLSIGDVD